jgi:hypothetical protein
MDTPPNDQSQPEAEPPTSLSDLLSSSQPAQESQPEPAATSADSSQPQHYQPRPQSHGGGNGVYCTTCGQYNAAWRSVCERCGEGLVRSSTAARVPAVGQPVRSGYYASAAGYSQTGFQKAKSYGYGYQRERPGCVTVYAILMVLAALLILFGSFALSSSSSSYSYSGAANLSGFLILVAIGGTVYNFIAAYGIWNLKNWGRIMVLIGVGLGIASNVLQLCTTMSAASSASQSTLLGAIIGIPLAGYVFYWFYNNGELFE